MPRRRTLLAVLSGIIVCSLVVAAAASLGGITSSSLGADDSVVASCDTNGVTSAYSTVYNTTSTAGFKVNDLTVGGIDDACDGLTMTVTLTGAANASLGSATQVVPTAVGTTNVISLIGQSILAESVTGIHIVIS
jgi:hypothetical protein